MTTTKRISRGICDFVNVIGYIKHGKYPKVATDGEKRSLRKRSKSFRLDGENLYYLMNTSESSDDVSQKHDRLVVLTDEQRLEIIAEAHVDQRGVHLGREKATAIINKKYYWVGVSNMVREYSRACQVCRANRAAQSQAYELYRAQIITTKEEDEFRDVETASSMSSSLMSTSSDLADDSIKMEWQISSDPVAFGEVVELSVFGPYKCQKSSRYVVVFLDVFSGWPEAYLLDTVTPADITHLVMKWVCRFGVMQNLNVKDCGSSCSTTQCQPLTNVLKDQGLFDVVIHQCSTAWNSSAQWNEVEEKVATFIENNECWDKCLDFALLPLRISRGKDAEYTPSYLTFGRELRLPLYLSHREDVSSTSATLDPHLTIGQMQCSTDRLVQLYTEYASDMGKEFKEQNVDFMDKKNFKVPTTSSNLSGKKRGKKKKRGLQQLDKEVEDDIDDSDVVYSTDGSEDSIDIPLSTGFPKGSRKRKPKHSQQLKESKHMKTETVKEADNDGDFENCDQEISKVSLDVFYGSILMYLEDQTYPLGSSEHLKRSVRKAHTSYSLEDGKLMYNTGSTGKKQVITSLKGRMELLKSAHIDLEGNHMPVRQVTKELSHYYWRSMLADCHAFVAACPACDTKHSEKKKNLQEVALLASVRKFEKISEVAEKHYSLLIEYLQKSKFPPSATDKDKTAVQKIADQFKLVKGVLYLIDKSSSMCVEIASRARKMAIKSAHTSTGSAVPSFEELCAEVSQKYIWHSLTTDVHHYLTTLDTTAQGSVKPTNVEKKRLEFLEYFKDEKAFFEKHDSHSATKSTQSKGKENNEVTAEIGLDMHVDENEDESECESEEICMSNDSELQVMDETINGNKTGSDLCQGTGTEVGLSSYVSNTPNKVFLVSTTRNPTETESTVTVHITEEADKDNKSDKQESSLISEKEVVITRKSQLSDLGEGGLVQLANALALVSDPLTEAAVQSIIDGSDSSQKGKVKLTQNPSTKATKSTNKKTTVGVASTKVPSSSSHENPQDTEEVTGEETGDGKKKKRTCLFTCEICNQIVRGSVKFKIHLSKHNGQKPFQCEVCNKQFTNIKSKRLHMRRHTGVTPYLCNLCGKKFSLIGSLKAHIKIHEKGGNVKIICKICNRTFASKNRFERHMQFKHPNTPPVYKCDACSKFFTTSRSLRRHTMSFHMNVKYHLCGVCGKSFFRKEYLTSHLAQHQGLSGVRKIAKKRDSSKAERGEEIVHVEHMGPTVVQQQVPHISESGTIMVDSSALHSNIQNIPHTELQVLEQSDVQNIGSSVVRHIGSSGVTRPSQEALETYQATHIVATGDVVSDNMVPVTLYSNSPVHYTDTGAQVESTYYTIETPSQDDEQQVAHTVVYGYPAVQYEVECSSGADQLNSEDLSAINLLAQASVCQGSESITYVTHGYQ